MPIPRFTDELGATQLPGITVVKSGNFFEDDKETDTTPPDVNQMNNEIFFTSKDDSLVFLEGEPQDDLPLKAFLSERKN